MSIDTRRIIKDGLWGMSGIYSAVTKTADRRSLKTNLGALRLLNAGPDC